MGKKIQLTETELINLIEKMVKEYDKPAMASFQKQYGKKKGKSVYYATANKQKRNPETFKIKKLTESNLDDKEKFKKLINKYANEISQRGYSDVYDWMSRIFDAIEWDISDEYDDTDDIISELKDEYDEYLMGMWNK
jgi:hypothetical protein